jgi:hypothetical protein
VARATQDIDNLPESPELREALRHVMAAHYEDWISEEIPALGGRTPLEVVREQAGRE